MLTEVTTGKKTYEDYELLEEGAPYQLIDGEFVMTPAPTPFHQEIIVNIITKLRPFLQQHSLGRLMISPLDIKLGAVDVYQPDLVLFLPPKAAKVGKERIEVIPDLVIEVLSPSTAYYDLYSKRDIYALSGVLEYWIIDPKRETVEVLTNRGGNFESTSVLQNKGNVESVLLPGFNMSLEEIFAF